MDISDLDADFPPIEIVTDRFRGTAQNFFTLPMHILIDLKEGQRDGNGEDFMVLIDAAAMAFGEKEFEALEDLPFNEFMQVVRQWVHKSQPIEDTDGVR